MSHFLQIRIFLVLFIFSQSAISYILSQMRNPLDIFVLQTTFSERVFRGVVESWSPKDLHYFYMHYYFDFFHPLLYGYLFYLMLYSKYKKSTRSVIAIPFIAATCDIIENSSNLYLVANMDKMSQTLLSIGGTAGSIKWVCIGLVLLLLFKKSIHEQVV